MILLWILSLVAGVLGLWSAHVAPRERPDRQDYKSGLSWFWALSLHGQRYKTPAFIIACAMGVVGICVEVYSFIVR